MKDTALDALAFFFTIGIAVVGVFAFGKNHPPMSRRYRAFLITLAISAATQAALRLLGDLFGDDVPVWQISLMAMTSGLLLAGMLLAMLTAAVRTPARRRDQQSGQRESQT